MTPLWCVNLLALEELLRRWGKEAIASCIMLCKCDTLCSWRSLRIPACPSASLHEGFSCNWKLAVPPCYEMPIWVVQRAIKPSLLCEAISTFQSCREQKTVSIAAVPTAEQRDHPSHLEMLCSAHPLRKGACSTSRDCMPVPQAGIWTALSNKLTLSEWRRDKHTGWAAKCLLTNTLSSPNGKI